MSEIIPGLWRFEAVLSEWTPAPEGEKGSEPTVTCDRHLVEKGVALGCTAG